MVTDVIKLYSINNSGQVHSFDGNLPWKMIKDVGPGSYAL